MYTQLLIKILAGVLTVINITGYVLVGIDKYKAIHNKWRIPERTLFIFAFIGSCPGIYLGMLLFRHKTQHKKFMLGIPAIFILQAILAIVLLYMLN